jgi:hypothetical protein
MPQLKKQQSARDLQSAAEQLSDTAEDIRTQADICDIDRHTRRLTNIAYELDTIAAQLRLDAIDR